jgi:hypothetical protein
MRANIMLRAYLEYLKYRREGYSKDEAYEKAKEEVK